MILVVEGISASGKTTWCTKHGGPHVIPENGRFENEPDRKLDPAGAAAFWAERNVDRWQAALAWKRFLRGLCVTVILSSSTISGAFGRSARRANKTGEQSWTPQEKLFHEAVLASLTITSLAA